MCPFNSPQRPQIVSIVPPQSSSNKQIITKCIGLPEKCNGPFISGEIEVEGSCYVGKELLLGAAAAAVTDDGASAELALAVSILSEKTAK